MMRSASAGGSSRRPSRQPPRISLKLVPHAASAAAVLFGGGALVGRYLDVRALKSVVPGLVTMKASTALAFVLAGAALWLIAAGEGGRQTGHIASVCAVIVSLAGSMLLSEYLLGRDLGIDRLLVPQPGALETPGPGRTAPTTALSFLLLGVALLLGLRRGYRLAQVLSLTAAALSFLALTGRAYGAESLRGVAMYADMPGDMAITFLALCAGLLFAHPDRGLAALVTSGGAGGVMARRLLPAAIAVPLGVGWLRLAAERAGLYGTEFGLSLIVVSNMGIFFALIWLSARSLDRTDRERQRAAEVLRESEARYRGLLEAAPDAVVIADGTGRIVLVNAQAERMFGYTREELLGHSVEMLLPERFRTVHVKHRATYHSDPGTRRPMGTGFELAGRRKSGDEFPVDIGLSPFETAEGILVTSVIRDITERRRAEQALRAADARYRGLFDAVPVGLFIMIGAGQVVDANAALLEMLGHHDRDSLTAVNAAFLFADPESSQRFQDLIEREGVVRGFEARMRRLDGSLIWARLSARAVRDPAGRALYYEGAAEDVTARKEGEDALRESEANYRALFEESRDAIYVVTREGSFLGFNQAVLDLYGYTGEEMARLNVRDLWVHPGERETFQRVIEEKGFVRDHEVKLRRKDGSEIDCLMTASVRPARAGSPSAYQGIVRDVTERKRLEEQIRQLQKLDAVGRLAGGIAHDFNNLLTVIGGRIQILLNRLRPDGRTRDDLVLMQKTVERAAGLTKQLLAFSRKQILQPRVLDLNAVVGGIAPLLARLIREDIELTTRLDGELGRVRADPGQIEQVIMNLAVNARDAMPAGGRLTIETANVELDDRYARDHAGVEPGPYVMLAVSDTGSGMDADTQAHIFEPFFTTKEAGKGTGLGLSTVYGIVKQSGGHVWVYSEPGRGTSFKIYLPRVEAPADMLAAEAAATPPRGSETILLVEDDEGVRDLAREILQAFGYRVLEAGHGNEALAVARHHPGPLHLLVTDVVMPGMSGREVAEALARERPETKALYLSGYTENAVVHHGVVEASMAFLQKPFTPDTLAREVREVLDQGPNRVAGAGPS